MSSTTPRTRQEVDNLLPITERFKYFAHVVGHIQSTRRDLAFRQEDLFRRLQNDGWTVFSRGTSIDPSLIGQVHTVDVYMHKKGSDYGPGEEIRAQAAMFSATTAMFFTYSPVLATAGEVATAVVSALQDLPKVPSMIPWWAWALGVAVGAAIAAPYIAPLISLAVGAANRRRGR